MIQSIKDYVTRRLVEGASLDVIWLEVKERYPGHRAGWNYLLSIKRKWEP